MEPGGVELFLLPPRPCDVIVLLMFQLLLWVVIVGFRR